MRECLLRVPTAAADEIHVTRNESGETDEWIRSRVELVPVRYGSDGVAPPLRYPSCVPSCRGPCCSFRFRCVWTGGSVRSESIVCDPPEYSFLPGVPISLGPVEFEGVGRLGVGTKNTCTCPPAFFTIPFEPSLDPRKRWTEPQIEDLVSGCPKGVFERVDGNVRASASYRCDGCMECVRKGLDFRDTKDEDVGIAVRPVRGTYRFPIESVGHLSESEIVRFAMDTYFLRSM